MLRFFCSIIKQFYINIEILHQDLLEDKRFQGDNHFCDII